MPCYWVNKHLYIKSVIKNNHLHVYNCGTKYPENQHSDSAIPCFNNLIGNSDNKRDRFNRLSATNLDTYSIRFRDKVRCFFFFFFCGGHLLGFIISKIRQKIENFDVPIRFLEHMAFIIVNMVFSRS